MVMARRLRWLMESKAGGAGYRKGFAPVAGVAIREGNTFQVSDFLPFRGRDR